MLLFNNDDVLHHMTTHSGLMSRQKSSGSISLGDMNSYISASLAGVFQPLGSKPKRVKGKSKEVGSNMVINTDKKIEKNNYCYSGVKFSKTDPVSRKLSYSLDEWQGRPDVRGNRSLVTASQCSVASYISDDSVYLPSTVGDIGTRDEMSKQPRSTASALLRYQGIVSPSSLKSRTSNAGNSQSLQLAAGVPGGDEPWEMLRSVCTEPSKKFATVHHISKRKVSWETLTQSLIHSMRRYDRRGTQFSSICSLLVARGDHDGSFAKVSAKIEEKLRHSLRYVEWNPFPVDFWISEYSM